jgi:hypothetical protein
MLISHLLQIQSSNPAVYDYMLGVVLPGIEKLAKELPRESFSILKAGQEGKVELTKRQIAQILANGFFCNFIYNWNLPHINFDKYDTKFFVLLLSLKTTTLIFILKAIQYARK